MEMATLGIEFDTKSAGPAAAAIDGVTAAAGRNVQAVDALSTTQQKSVGASESMWTAQQRATKASEAAARQANITEKSVSGMAAAAAAVAPSVDKGSEAADKFVKTLEKQAATLGFTSLQMKAYEASTKTFTDAQALSVANSLTAIKAHEDNKTAMERSEEMGSRLASVLMKLGVAALAAATAFAYKVERAMDADAELARLSMTTGIYVEKLSGLKYAADLSDTSVGTLARGLQNLGRSLIEARGNADSVPGRGFAFLGIDPNDLKTKEQAVDAIADAIKRTEDPLAKSAALQMVLKQRGEELVPFFNEGAAGIRRMTEEGERLNPVTAENARQAKELKDNIVTLQYASGQLAREISRDLVPTLNDLILGFLNARKEGASFFAAMRGAALASLEDDPVKAYSALYGKLKVMKENFARDEWKMTFAGRWIDKSEIERAEAELAALQAKKDAYMKKGMPDFSDVNTVPIKGLPDPRGGGGGGADKAEKNEFASTERYVKGLNEQLLRFNGEGSEVEKVMRRIADPNEKWNDALRITAILTAELIDSGKALKAQAEADAKSKQDETAANFNFLDSIEKQIEAENKRTIAIGESKEQRLYAAAMEIDAQKRKIEADRDMAVQDLDGVARDDETVASTARVVKMYDEQIAALERLRQAKLRTAQAQESEDKKDAQVKKALDDAKGISQAWADVARSAQQTMSSLFFDVMNRSTDSIGRKIGDLIKKMVADGLAAQATIALFGDTKNKSLMGASGGGLVGAGMSILGGLLKSSGDGGNAMTGQDWSSGGSSNAGGGGWISTAVSLIGGLFKAGGGPTAAGEDVVVGERGPEVFRPAVAGSIVPNHMLRGGGNIYYIDAKGADRTGLANLERKIKDLDGSIEKRALGAFSYASGRGGPLGRTLRGG